MKRLTNFLFALVLTAALTSCIYDFGNNTGASGAVLSNNGKDNKITSLSALIDQTPEDGTINLSEYADITDYSASINKAVTINAGNIDMNDCSLSINESGVILNGLNNANVSANPGIGNGSLKISSSSLNSLTILGGGLNSIHLLNGTTITGKTIIGKEYNAAQNDQEPVRLVMDSTIFIADLTIKSSAVLDSGTSEVNDDNLKSVIFDIDKTNAESSVNVAVSANLTFTTPQQTNFARVQFQSSTASDARMDIFVMKKNETVTISKDFFTDAFQRLIGEVTKDEIETEFSAYIGHSITESDISSPISVDNLIEPVTVTLYYYNGDEAENFTFAKGKKLDISAQGKTKDGYVFRGWSTDIGAEEADPELTAGEFVTVNEDKTFYFVWKKDETTATTIPYVEYDGSFTKWCFSGKIEEISESWVGSSTAPTFGILFMDSQTINEMMNLDIEILKDGNRTNRWLFNRPSGHSVYQLVRKNDNGIENLTFSTNQIGTYKTRYEGLIYSIVDENKYAIYLDKDKIKKTDMWAFGQGYSTMYDVSGDTVTKNEQQLTDDDALNLDRYIPIVLALSDNSQDQNYLTQFWQSSMIRMSPYKGELPTYEGSVAGLEAWFASHNNPITDFCLTITDTVPDMTSDSAKTAFAACPSSFTLDLSKCTAFSSVNQNTTLLGNTKLTKVILPSSVTDIQGGFIECPSLTEVVIDNGSFKSEDGIVFSNNSTNRSIVLYPSGKQAVSYTIPNGVTTIGDNAFKSNNNLTTVVIPDSVTTIMGGAFASMSNLTSITIPASVTNINDNVFNSCDKLKVINVADGNANYKSVADILFEKDTTGNLVTLIHYPAAKSDTSYEIPSTVTDLAPAAFLNCKNLESITLNSITPPSLGVNAFAGCNALANIYVPNSAVEDYKEASGWSAYADIISAVGDDSSSSSSASSSSGDDSSASSAAGDDSSSSSSSSGDDNSSSSSSSGDDNSSSSSSGDGSNYSELSALLNSDITYPQENGVNGLSSWLGNQTETDKTYLVKLSDVDSSNIATLKTALKNSSLKINLDLWQCTGLTNMDSYEFSSCKSLVNIILPKTITSITGEAFWYCSSLQNIYVDNETANYCSDDGVLFNKGKTTLVKYPSGKTNTTYNIPSSVNSLADYAFSDAENLTEMIIPSNVSTLGFRAFSQSGLNSLTLNNGLTEIGEEAFVGISITSVSIPTTVTSIASLAFESSSLTSITIQGNNTELSDGALRYCKQLTNIVLNSGNTRYKLDEFGDLLSYDGTKFICYPAGKTDTEYTIPSTVTSIANFAFSSCEKLTSITIASGVTSIGRYAFEDCSGITNLSIPDSVETLDTGAVFRCTSLTSVTIGDGITSIGSDAFNSCSALTTFTISATTPPSLGLSAFGECTNLTTIYVPSESIANTYKAELLSDGVTSNPWHSYESMIQVKP